MKGRDRPHTQRRLVVATRALRLDALAYLDQIEKGAQPSEIREAADRLKRTVEEVPLLREALDNSPDPNSL